MREHGNGRIPVASVTSLEFCFYTVNGHLVCTARSRPCEKFYVATLNNRKLASDIGQEENFVDVILFAFPKVVADGALHFDTVSQPLPM